MSYIGNTNITQAFTPAVDFFNGDGSTVAFTLSKPVASVAQVQAVISNVPQNPGSAYTVSGNTITFTSAPPSGTANIYVYYTSPITQVIAPGQNTVGTAQIQNGAVIPADLSTGGPYWDTSGNVGIGTTSPATQLHLSSATPPVIRLQTDTTSSAYGVNWYYTSSASVKGAVTLNLGTAEMRLSAGESGNSYFQTFYTNATERMRLDASGNLGLGVTPSAWASDWKVAQFGARGLAGYYSATPSMFVGYNFYFAGTGGSSPTYIASAPVTSYQQAGGYHYFYAAPSGTAGTAVTFTQVAQVGKDTTFVLQGGSNSSGTGIAFPATQNASSDANTLDDYEEGTWTPTIASGGNTIASYDSVKYTKIGRTVSIQIYIGISAGTAGVDFQLGGLPFTVASGGYCTGIADIGNYGVVGAYARVSSGTTTVQFLYPSGVAGTSRKSVFGNQVDSYLIFSLTYFV